MAIGFVLLRKLADTGDRFSDAKNGQLVDRQAQAGLVD